MSKVAVSGAAVERSMVGLLGEALTLPFRHAIRLAAYGLLPLAILLTGSLLFPAHTILAAVSIPFYPGSPAALAELDDGIGSAITIWMVTLVALGFLLCAWQRDVVHGFRTPVGRVVRDGAWHVALYMPVLALWVIPPLFLAAAILIAMDSIGAVGGPATVLAGLLAGVPALWLLARLSLMPPLTAALGLRDGSARGWQAGSAIAGSLAACFLACGLLLVGGLYAGAQFEQRSITLDTLPAMLTWLRVYDVSITVVALLWITAVAALRARHVAFGSEIDPATFD